MLLCHPSAACSHPKVWIGPRQGLVPSSTDASGPPSTLCAPRPLNLGCSQVPECTQTALVGKPVRTKGPLLEQPWRRLSPLSRVPGHPWFSQQFQDKHRQMALRIADLCLGTDKDWKMGRTKIFLKVRSPGLLGMMGRSRGGGQFHSACPVPSWAVGSSSHRFMHCLSHNGDVGSRQEGAVERQANRGTIGELPRKME